MLDGTHHSASGDDDTSTAGNRGARILLLWDVDHTLIDNGGVSKEIYAGAFSLLVGRPAEHPPRTDGRTDTEIMHGMLAAHGLRDVPLSLARLGEVLMQAAADKVHALRERGHALPGALALLTTLHDDHPDVIQSVLTGNVQSVALVKLGAFGLDRYLDFEVGGFGSDGAVRSDLVGVAQRKAARKYGLQFDRSTTVLVGDTPRDVQAGRQGGAYVLAVASGASTPEELSAEGADVVLSDLRETRTVINAILAVRCNRGIGSQG